MSFSVSANYARNAVLVSFHGHLTREDFKALDELAGRFGGETKYDVVFDMTEVAQVDVTADFVATRGTLPQAFPGRERIYVVPEKSLKALAAVYAGYQAAEGWRRPAIVGTLEEALARLGLQGVAFGPLPALP